MLVGMRSFDQAAAGEGYRCYEPGCYRLTSHLPVFAELCLARVDSIGFACDFTLLLLAQWGGNARRLYCVLGLSAP